jgi:hypothetical protein
VRCFGANCTITCDGGGSCNQEACCDASVGSTCTYVGVAAQCP